VPDKGPSLGTSTFYLHINTVFSNRMLVFLMMMTNVMMYSTTTILTVYWTLILKSTVLVFVSVTVKPIHKRTTIYSDVKLKRFLYNGYLVRNQAELILNFLFLVKNNCS
jgi:hypothetical protein